MGNLNTILIGWIVVYVNPAAPPLGQEECDGVCSCFLMTRKKYCNTSSCSFCSSGSLEEESSCYFQVQGLSK